MTVLRALQILAADPEDIVVFAGGTDLMVEHHAGLLKRKRILDLSSLNELKKIEVDPEAITIGALCTYSQIRNHKQINNELPMLAAAARVTGALAIQNRGTIGGNIANASPAADTPPALLAYDANLILASVRGEREIEYADFHKGYKKTERAKDELIVKIVVRRRRPDSIDYYEKVGARAAQAISKVGIAATARRDGMMLRDVRIAFSSVAPQPLRCTKTESILEGRELDDAHIDSAIVQLGHEIAPIDDIRSDAQYRRQVAKNLLGYFLRTKIFQQ